MLPPPIIFRESIIQHQAENDDVELVRSTEENALREAALVAQIAAVQARIRQIDQELERREGPALRALAQHVAGGTFNVGVVPPPAPPAPARRRGVRVEQEDRPPAVARVTARDVATSRRRAAREARLGATTMAGATLYGRPKGPPLRRRAPPPERGGSRTLRGERLTATDLYVDGIGPPDQPPKEPIHMCGVCHMAKSHPVTYVRPLEYKENADVTYQEYVWPQFLLRLHEIVA